MTLIINTEQHTDTGLIVEPFGDDGAMHLTPVVGTFTGPSFILDAPAVRELAALLAKEEL